eukprot:Hpha_TRINITY_DN14982_c4_g4::TRINITY_DN14982_c4_g4_i1::g.143354::m.143354
MRAGALLFAGAAAAQLDAPNHHHGEGCLGPFPGARQRRPLPDAPPHTLSPDCRADGPWVPPALNSTPLAFETQRNRLGLDVRASRCSITPSRAECDVEVHWVGDRPVYYQTPLGTPPAGGWPVMLYFHAWYSGGINDWAANYPNNPGRDGGVYWEIETKKALLDMGVAWVSPDATRRGNPCPNNRNCWWETNDAPYNVQDLGVWTRSHDAAFLEQLFGEMQGGGFGAKLDLTHMHTGGYSSGGFMASRTAFNYTGMFKSHFNLAASLYYCCGCGGSTCPEAWLDSAELAAKVKTHPPTIFLHGAADACVSPVESAMYHRRLQAAGIDTKYVSPSGQGHHWFPDSAKEVADWVQKYN